MKKLWLSFTKYFGTSIIHPQYIVKKIEYSAITFAKQYASGKLLDIGCGNMPYKDELLQSIKQYVGLDYPITNKMYEGAPKPDILADAKNLPLKNNSFDSVLMLQVLEHIDEPQKALDEATRVLKKGGTLIISIPFLYPLHDTPHDYTRFTQFTLKQMLKPNYKIIKFVVDGNFIDFWLQSLLLFLFSRAKQLIETKNIFAVFWAVVLIAIGLPMGLIANIASEIVHIFNGWFGKPANIFPLNYTIVAKRTK